jgi:hypothetical protein
MKPRNLCNLSWACEFWVSQWRANSCALACNSFTSLRFPFAVFSHNLDGHEIGLGFNFLWRNDWKFFSFLWRIRLSYLFPFAFNLRLETLQIVGRTPLDKGSTSRRTVTCTKQYKQTKHRHTVMPRVRFDSTIERGKTFHALDRAATVIGSWKFYERN